MTAPNWAVWEWRDSDNIPRYVGWGNFQGTHPARLKWSLRYEDDSELHVWLQTLGREPTRITIGSKVMPRNVAKVLYYEYKTQYDATLYKTRGSKTRSGGGRCRKVLYVGENFNVIEYPSVRRAARALHTSDSTITRRCQNPENRNYFFLDRTQETS